ncbi:MAG: hypothetical protein U0359_36300 [Byssovorax sp.]
MPLLPYLDFTARALTIAYRASPDPQDLTIDVAAAGLPAAPFAHMAMRAVVDAINAGAAGGDVFSPSAGRAERLAGPWFDGGALGRSYRWVIEVASVAPLFVRNIVEELRRSGMNQDVVAMSLVGSLPVDASPMSVREPQVRAWIEDPAAYLPAWPSPGFPISVVPRETGAALRLTMAQPLTPPIRAALEDLSVNWLNFTRNYIGDHGGPVYPDPHRTLPSFGQGKSEFRALYGDFPHARMPSRALVINMLTRFHERVARIAEAEVAL